MEIPRWGEWVGMVQGVLRLRMTFAFAKFTLRSG